MKISVKKLANIIRLPQEKKFCYLNRSYLPIINAANFYTTGLLRTGKYIITELVNSQSEILMESDCLVDSQSKLLMSLRQNMPWKKAMNFLNMQVKQHAMFSGPGI